MKNFPKNFRRTVNRSSQTRNLLEFPPTSPKQRERRGIHRNPETGATLDHPELQSTGFAINIENQAVLLLAPLLA
jgi:hypothetical protein